MAAPTPAAAAAAAAPSDAASADDHHHLHITSVGDFRDQDKIFKSARSKAEKDRIHRVAIEESMKGAFYGLVAATAINYTLVRFVPAYSKIHRTPKWIAGLAFPITGFVLNGEHAALQLEREYALQRSYVKDLDGLPGEVKKAVQAEIKVEKVTLEDVKHYVLENRYKVVGLGWAGVVGSVLVSTWANKNMPVAQKIITARVAAQASALAGFVAFAFAAAVPVDKDTAVDKLNRQYYERMLAAETDSDAAKWAERWAAHASEEDLAERKKKLDKRLEEEARKKAAHRALAELH